MKSIKTMFILLCGMLGHFIAYSQDLNSSVYFESGESKLSKKALVELEEVLEICKKYPDVAIDIKAYADDRGSEKMNQKLSKRRASRVVQFLKENGLNPHKQLVNGLGEVALKNKNDVTSERQRNRRVDIEIKPFAPQNWDDYYSFYKKRNTEVFQIRNDRDTCIVGKKGTVLFIPKHSFQTKNNKGRRCNGNFVERCHSTQFSTNLRREPCHYSWRTICQYCTRNQYDYRYKNGLVFI